MSVWLAITNFHQVTIFLYHFFCNPLLSRLLEIFWWSIRVNNHREININVWYWCFYLLCKNCYRIPFETMFILSNNVWVVWRASRFFKMFIFINMFIFYFFIANIDLHSVNFIVTQLRKSLESLVLTDNVHLLYLVTPLDQVDDLQVNWMLYYKQVGSSKHYVISKVTWSFN